MENLIMKYGKENVEVNIPKKNLLGIIKSNFSAKEEGEEEIIKKSLENPIESRVLKEIVNPGEKICIVISDITRAWQKMGTYLPYIVEELSKAGIEDKDIIFISATGTHRAQTKEEHRVLLGEKLANRFEVIDHICTDKDNMVYLGETSYKTPVHINKKALECDHIILTGAIVFHFLAGWGGGKKSILPGISSYETVMANHALSLSTVVGEGSNPLVRSGNVVNNPVNQDMLEAANMVNVSFLFNVIMDSNGKICSAVAGDFVKAYEEGCKIVEEMDGVEIEEKSDLVIASAGGYPKDINLYQTSKTLINAKEAVKKGGSIIILSECEEGIGNPEVGEMIQNYKSNIEREIALRKDYTISRYIGYFFSEAAEYCNLILVSKIDPNLVKDANIKVAKTIEDALNMVYEQNGKNLKTYLMPYGANTLPKQTVAHNS